MKANKFISIVATSFILIGCIQDESATNEFSDGVKEKISITATQGGAITRISHEDDGAEGLILKWTENDAFKLYGTTTEVFTTTGPTDSNGKIATFEGNAVADAQYAFFPALKAENRWEDCYFNVIGQVIDANAPFAHLAGYNFMTTQTNASGTEISDISFEHKIAVLKFNITLPTDIIPKYVTLSTQDDAGIVVSQKASDESDITTAKQLTAAITGATGANFIAYMAILPSTLKEKLSLAVTGDDDMVYNYTVSFDEDFSYEAGKVYNSVLTFKSVAADGYETATIFDNNVNSTAWDQSGDKGTENNPYLIENAEHLKYLIEQVEEGEPYLDKYFKLTTDIKVTTDTWTPIGISSAKPFSGNFDGGGHTISGDLRGIFSDDIKYFGFFGYLNNSSSTTLVQNLHVAANVTWSFGNPEGTSSLDFGVGGIAGYIYNTVTIRNCTMSGEMQISGGSLNYGILNIGGIVGYIRQSYLLNCSAIGKMNVNCKGNLLFIGEIIGRGNHLSWETKYCVSTSSIMLSDIEHSNTAYSVSVGGIAGYHAGKPLGCCFQGTITGNSLSSVDVGGIVGLSEWAKLHQNRNLTKYISVTSNGTVQMGYLVGNLGANATVYSCNESVGEQTKWIGNRPSWTPTPDDVSAH